MRSGNRNLPAILVEFCFKKVSAPGDTPGNSWWGCVTRLSKSWPHFSPKNVIFHTRFQTWGPFLESPKSNIQIEMERIRARVLASKLLHFVSLTDSIIMLDAKLLKPLSCISDNNSFAGPLIIRTFEKRASGI